LARDFTARRFGAVERLDAAFLAALPFGVLAPAVLRPVFRFARAVRFVPAPLRLAARTPAPARRLEGVFFCRFVLADFFAICGLSLSVLSFDLRKAPRVYPNAGQTGPAAQTDPRRGVDESPLSDVSSTAYRKSKGEPIYSPPELRSGKYDPRRTRFAWQLTNRTTTTHKEVA
jgi:hypothetical protein